MTEAQLPPRARVAVAAGKLTGAVSRAAGRGSGAVVGGRVALRLDPELLRRLTAGRSCVLISATNGKTTTTRLAAEALRAKGQVASNALGANMPAGITAAMASDRTAQFAVIEVDEKYLPGVAEQTAPAAIALLNLSRDQLDRAAETRMLAQRWRDGLAGTAATVIANADDPLVVWAAGRVERVVWVAVGQSWKDDAWSCPQCGGVLHLEQDDWGCGSCDLRRPKPEWSLDGTELVAPDDTRVALTGLRLPGRANRANAVSAAAVAAVFGVEPGVAIGRMEHVTAVAGRYDTVSYRGRTLRLLLAKNPAGWLETFDLVAPLTRPDGQAPVPVLLSVNALSADGTDTSWLWDVDYTRLAGHKVLVIGQRRLDLAVRLQVAGVEFEVFDTVEAAVDAAPAGEIEVIANYTAFQQLRQKVGG
ncbi:Mur ligase family protein [Actinospica robiniae]|uniref:Mur ligase family protein n=1 Tax=Actinospica robiniae TaxID=304901 RepID=UPI0005584C0A|nr:MurT ligase domain-containing protein [Actinospica robiniae]